MWYTGALSFIYKPVADRGMLGGTARPGAVPSLRGGRASMKQGLWRIMAFLGSFFVYCSPEGGAPVDPAGSKPYGPTRVPILHGHQLATGQCPERHLTGPCSLSYGSTGTWTVIDSVGSVVHCTTTTPCRYSWWIRDPGQDGFVGTKLATDSPNSSISWTSNRTSDFELVVKIKQLNPATNSFQDHADAWWTIRVAPRPQISGSTYLTEKRVYYYDGSATGGVTPYTWRWDKQDQASPTWRFWSSQQNTSYVPYAGSYYFYFRLTATDQKMASGSISRRITVCVGCPPAPKFLTDSLALIEPLGADESPAVDFAALHFGSGPWVSGIVAATGDPVASMYFDPHGNEDGQPSLDPVSGVANFLGETYAEVNDRFVAQGRSTGITVTQQVLERAPDRWILEYTFTASEKALTDAVLGLAFDPDLSADASADMLSIDGDMAVVSSTLNDQVSGYLGYLFHAPDGPQEAGRFIGFTPSLDSPSSSDDEAVFEIMKGETQIPAGTAGGRDVRFGWFYSIGSLPLGSSKQVRLAVATGQTLPELLDKLGSGF